MWQNRKRRRDEVLDATASRINGYMVWLRKQLARPEWVTSQAVPSYRLQLTDIEITALVTTVASCAQSILYMFAKEKPVGYIVSNFDVCAACVLARKTTLGYDHERLVVHRGEGQYDDWIVEHLRRNNWKACEKVQRAAGELPPIQAIDV